MEIFASDETDVEVPPLWKANATTPPPPSLYPTKTDLLLAYAESIRYAEPWIQRSYERYNDSKVFLKP